MTSLTSKKKTSNGCENFNFYSTLSIKLFCSNSKCIKESNKILVTDKSTVLTSSSADSNNITAQDFLLLPLTLQLTI